MDKAQSRSHERLNHTHNSNDVARTHNGLVPSTKNQGCLDRTHDLDVVARHLGRDNKNRGYKLEEQLLKVVKTIPIET